MDFMIEQKNRWITERETLLRFSYNRYGNDGSWDNAIDIFKELIDKRYIGPLDTIINSRNNEGEGIFILQSQIILFEILAGFSFGRIFRPGPNVDFYYSDNRELLIDFLKSEPLFEAVFEYLHTYFGSKRRVDIYFDFYWNVRCGLIHTGVLRNNWMVNTQVEESPFNYQFVEIEAGKKVIYRNRLQNTIKKYLRKYLTELSESKDANRRKFFARRMDFHFGIEEYEIW